jgi:hypothetical protein
MISLAVVLGVLVLSVIASLIWPAAAKPPTEGKTGSVFGHAPPE